MSKKIFSLALLLGLLVNLAPLPVSAADNFPDINTIHPYAAAVENIKTAGIVSGYPDGNFRLNNNINRAEFTKIIIESAYGNQAITGANCFPDVQEEWFAPFVCTAKSKGLIAGYPDGTFHPGDPINFAEASKIISQAFKTTIEKSNSSLWFADYTNALTGSAAVPITVDGVGDYITRGEMSEMVYRLREKETDKPSLSKDALWQNSELLTGVPRIGSCAELTERMQIAAANQSYPIMYRGLGLDDGIVFSEEKTTEAVPQATNTLAGAVADHSETNVQVAGVDEGDIVKNDGKYFYFLRDQDVRILNAYPATELSELAKIEFTEDENFQPQDLYIDGNRLVVIGQSWTSYDYKDTAAQCLNCIRPYYRSSYWTKLYIYDISDRSKPVQKRTLDFEGDYQSSRLIENQLYLVINSYPDYRLWEKPILTDPLLPQFRDSKIGTETKPISSCTDIAYFPNIIEPHYLIVAGVNIADDSKTVKREVYLGSGTNVYASLNNLYVATTNYYEPPYFGNYDYYVSPEEKTRIYKFALNNGDVDFVTQGSVPGTVLNQFSMDENGKYFRLATTTSPRWWGWRPTGQDVSANHVFVLDQDLKQVGSIRDIAPGEKIYSTRFLGDRVYVVTFRQVDPLFVIDLKDPANPKILGKLKIPGYSDYLHPYDADHIIGFGKSTTETSSGGVLQQGFKMALFDITDVTKPQELFKEEIGDRGTESELLNDHHALLFSREKNLLAFPISIAEIKDADPDEWAYGQTVFQGAVIYSLDLVNGFKLRDKISHFDAEDELKAGDVFYYGGDSAIRRILYIGETLYTLSNATLQANELGNLNFIKKVNFQ